MNAIAIVMPQAADARPRAPAEQRRQMMAAVNSWAYQLQKLDVAALAASPFDLIVIDHAPDRVDSVEHLFRPVDLEPLKRKPDGSRRLVLAYLSIGEAERYRFYWDDAWVQPLQRPDWLGAVNPQWAGNFTVEFWQPGWRQLIFGRSDSYVDRVLNAGFDGVYLDRADVYEQFANAAFTRAQMVRFLADLADHARTVKPDALVVLQNAEELVRDKSVRTRIDAVAKESLFFNPDAASAAQPAGELKAALDNLRLARKAGRRVLAVEYTDDPVKVLDARARAAKEGFVIHFAERSLSLLNEKAPVQSALDGGPVPPPP